MLLDLFLQGRDFEYAENLRFQILRFPGVPTFGVPSSDPKTPKSELPTWRLGTLKWDLRLTMVQSQVETISLLTVG